MLIFSPSLHPHDIMPGLKRKPSLGSSKPSSSAAEPSPSSSKKKPRSDAPGPKTEPSTLVDSQVDFPRGGGTGLTPFEHASTLREARAEIAKSSRGGDDLFSDKPGKAKLSEEDEQKRREAKRKVNREKNNAKKKKVTLETAEEPKRKADKDHIRIEHLNYKVSL